MAESDLHTATDQRQALPAIGRRVIGGDVQIKLQQVVTVRSISPEQARQVGVVTRGVAALSRSAAILAVCLLRSIAS